MVLTHSRTLVYRNVYLMSSSNAIYKWLCGIQKFSAEFSFIHRWSSVCMHLLLEALRCLMMLISYWVLWWIACYTYRLYAIYLLLSQLRTNCYNALHARLSIEILHNSELFFVFFFCWILILFTIDIGQILEEILV